jgi:hypothetical protein
MAPAGANAQPAAVVHHRDGSGRYQPYGVVVFTVGGGRIRRIVSFHEPTLVGRFTAG